MPEISEARPAGIKRVVFKEILPGARRKFLARSNDADTGGGARDLRFRPFDRFDAIFAKLFPEVRSEGASRGGARVQLKVRVGRFYWQEGRKVLSKEATFAPPTNARSEGYLRVVHTYPILNSPPPETEGRLVLLLVQDDDDRVWPHFVTEPQLRSGDWHEAVAREVLACLNAPRPMGRAARGFKDFETGQRFCNA